MQNRVFVLDAQRAPLMPCHPARARELLREGKAAVFRRFPFTIILNERNGGGTQNLTIKSDPGSKTTGLALVAAFRRGLTVIWAGELAHRGHIIHAALERRSDQRHSRRSRKTRHRAPRFDHRTRPAPVGHFKIPHLWSPKIPQAGRADYQLTEVFCASRVAASLSR